MKFLDTIKTSNSNLFRSKLRTILTILAIFVGSLTLSLTAGLGKGVEDYINKQVNAVSVRDALFILPSGFNTSTSALTGVQEYNPEQKSSTTSVFLTQNDVNRISEIKNIEEATLLFVPKPEYITRDGQKKYKDDLIDIMVKNMEMPLAAGNMPSKADEILLAYKFVEVLGFSTPDDAIGKQITYVFKNASGEERTIPLTVRGVQINNLSGSQNRISNELARELYPFQYGTTEVSQTAIVYLSPNLTADENATVRKDIEKLGYGAQSFEDQINTIKNFLNILQVSVNMFAIIVILAASIGIVNTLLMAVYERTREIGLMKALGMKSIDVFMLFAFEAASLGFWGGVFGVLSAIGIGEILNSIAATSFLKGFEGFTLFIYPPVQIASIVLGTLLVGLLAGTLPALKASRLNPIDALRYE